jgi:hypothetical protein
MASKLFALSDRGPGAPEELQHEQAARVYNTREHAGIFHVVNEFEGRRVVENLRAIRYWYADLDSGTKEEQLERIGKHLKPSRIVETRKGFHVYYRAIDATLGNWNRIVKYGLVPALEGDPRATDPLRLLRVPGYYHNKAEPFLVRTIAQSDVAYTETQMMEAFPDRKVEVKVDAARRDLGGSGTFWGRVAQLSARDVVERLSGSWLVRGEEFKLHETGGGKANILVKKQGRWQGTPMWVTEEDRLAGVEGGATASAFCKWYGHGWKEIAAGLKELFREELGDEKE